MAKKIGRPTRHEALAKEQLRALERLVGKPLAGKPQVEETAAARIAALIAHVRALKERENNPYQRSFTRFRTELCWTVDEARGGKVALMPDWPYLREVDDALVQYSPLLIEKSRRTLISWTACAFGLWLVAGGQDPRWVNEQGEAVLMNSRENRKIIVAARKLKGEGGSAAILRERFRFMVEQFEARGGREKWPEFPTFSWTLDYAAASNGGIISAVPQGADQVRGSGVTWILADELGFWSEAQASISSALQTLRGGGKLLGVTTANNSSFAHRIVTETIKRRTVEG